MFRNNLLAAAKYKPNIKFPEKLKGTIVEKWALYWKNLCIDYKQMFQDLRTDIQDNPRKAFKWTIGLTGAYLLKKNNPNEIEFKNEYRRHQNQIILLNDKCRNPISLEHIRYLQTCYNEGVIHYQSLGLFSVMYLSEYNDSCSLYKSQCEYLQPSYFSYPFKVIDIGIMGRWWNIYAKTTDYDVNVNG